MSECVSNKYDIAFNMITSDVCNDFAGLAYTTSMVAVGSLSTTV